MFFTCTPDLVSDFSAAAARELGLGDVPLMCAVEVDVPGAMPRIVRVMAQANMDVPRGEVKNVYLHVATALRRALATLIPRPSPHHFLNNSLLLNDSVRLSATW